MKEEIKAKVQNTDNLLITISPKVNLPVTDFVGETEIAGRTIRAAVLYPDSDNPTRVFVQREIVGLLTGNKKGGLSRYLKPKNLQPFLPEKFRNSTLEDTTIAFRSGKNGRIAQGFIGEDLIDICQMYMDADAKGALLSSQKNIAKIAKIIVFALAKSGVDNFIDNITGFEKVRNDYELVRNVKKYLLGEAKKYETQFPVEFYKHIFRLNKWAYDDESIKRRPSIIGKWTNEMIYARFPKGIPSRLDELNPITEKGYRKRKKYEHLTDEGIILLQEFISNAMFLMAAAPNWKRFKELFNRSLGKASQGDLFEDQ